MKLLRSLYDEYIVVKGKIHVWERVFATKFYQFTHQDWQGKTIHRAMEYSLPVEFDAHLEAVGNVAEFPTPTRGKPTVQKTLSKEEVKAAARKYSPVANKGPFPVESNPVIDKQKENFYYFGYGNNSNYGNNSSFYYGDDWYYGYVTPSVIADTYNITNSTGNGFVSQAVYSTIGQTMSPTDLAYFQAVFGLPSDEIDSSYYGYVEDTACYDSLDNCIEANLDFQYLMSTAQKVPTVSFYDGNSYWYEWMVTVSSMTDIPDVFTMSYASIDYYVSSSERTTFNTESMKLGIQGVTLLVASGDDGAGGFGVVYDYVSCGYWPGFPAVSAYWTVVGGTMGPESDTTEVACSTDNGGGITTGGGFASTVSRPSYQSSVVTTYWSTVSGTGNAPYTGYSSGRGYPDISVLANNYIIAANLSFIVVSGTSASSPVMAGMVSLVNSHRKAAGKSTMGFINPFLYAYRASFVHDITSGNNLCTRYSYWCCDQGYYAVSGWDPVTGLGSLDFTKFYTAAMSSTSTRSPTRAPTRAPTSLTRAPTRPPTRAPSQIPTIAPTKTPTQVPTQVPTKPPTQAPTKPPTREPTLAPSRPPTFPPTQSPTREPTVAPSKTPTQVPTQVPTKVPTQVPTKTPTQQPTLAPTKTPTLSPTQVPTRNPTFVPTKTPTQEPTFGPTRFPTFPPTKAPTREPTFTPTKTPTRVPTVVPTREPTFVPTKTPTRVPTCTPTKIPTQVPTKSPTKQPTLAPTKTPTLIPTAVPTKSPTTPPTKAPTRQPTFAPTKIPTEVPTKTPTKEPTFAPTRTPTRVPTTTPTKLPTIAPSKTPTQEPTFTPTKVPTQFPTAAPSRNPTIAPSRVPTQAPTTRVPTAAPSYSRTPTVAPTKAPTIAPAVAAVHILEEPSSKDARVLNAETGTLGGSTMTAPAISMGPAAITMLSVAALVFVMVGAGVYYMVNKMDSNTTNHVVAL